MASAQPSPKPPGPTEYVRPRFVIAESLDYEGQAFIPFAPFGYTHGDENDDDTDDE
jgi:hypothetical protein